MQTAAKPKLVVVVVVMVVVMIIMIIMIGAMVAAASVGVADRAPGSFLDASGPPESPGHHDGGKSNKGNGHVGGHGKRQIGHMNSPASQCLGMGDVV